MTMDADTSVSIRLVAISVNVKLAMNFIVMERNVKVLLLFSQSKC